MQVMGVYHMIAAITQEEAFLIDERRAGMIGGAMAEVSQHFNISASGPTMSLFKLGAALAIVNIPILMVVGQKRRAIASARAQATRPPTPDVAAVMGDGTAPPRKYQL